MTLPYNDGPFVTGQCLRCGFEAVGGICGECLAELADFIDGADLTGLARWASAWPAGRGAHVAAEAVAAATRHLEQERAAGGAADRPITARKARVRFLRDLQAQCPGAPGAVRYWRAGEVCTMWQLSARPGQVLDPATDRWWTDFDIDYAYIAPADAVEVLAVLERRSAWEEASGGHA